MSRRADPLLHVNLNRVEEPVKFEPGSMPTRSRKAPSNRHHKYMKRSAREPRRRPHSAGNGGVGGGDHAAASSPSAAAAAAAAMGRNKPKRSRFDVDEPTTTPTPTPPTTVAVDDSPVTAAAAGGSVASCEGRDPAPRPRSGPPMKSGSGGSIIVAFAPPSLRRNSGDSNDNDGDREETDGDAEDENDDNDNNSESDDNEKNGGDEREHEYDDVEGDGDIAHDGHAFEEDDGEVGEDSSADTGNSDSSADDADAEVRPLTARGDAIHGANQSSSPSSEYSPSVAPVPASDVSANESPRVTVASPAAAPAPGDLEFKANSASLLHQFMQPRKPSASAPVAVVKKSKRIRHKPPMSRAEAQREQERKAARMRVAAIEREEKAIADAAAKRAAFIRDFLGDAAPPAPPLSPPSESSETPGAPTYAAILRAAPGFARVTTSAASTTTTTTTATPTYTAAHVSPRFGSDQKHAARKRWRVPRNSVTASPSALPSVPERASDVAATQPGLAIELTAAKTVAAEGGTSTTSLTSTTTAVAAAVAVGETPASNLFTSLLPYAESSRTVLAAPFEVSKAAVVSTTTSIVSEATASASSSTMVTVAKEPARHSPPHFNPDTDFARLIQQLSAPSSSAGVAPPHGFESVSAFGDPFRCPDPSLGPLSSRCTAACCTPAPPPSTTKTTAAPMTRVERTETVVLAARVHELEGLILSQRVAHDEERRCLTDALQHIQKICVSNQQALMNSTLHAQRLAVALEQITAAGALHAAIEKTRNETRAIQEETGTLKEAVKNFTTFFSGLSVAPALPSALPSALALAT